MAFVPGYDHDIFVSYAHVDNQTLPGVKNGWVTTLVEGLRIELSRKLGRSQDLSLWMDHQLAGNVRITPEIMGNLQKSATLLFILSPGYLASEWCNREQRTFLKAMQERVRSRTRVFLVDLDDLPLNLRTC